MNNSNKTFTLKVREYPSIWTEASWTGSASYLLEELEDMGKYSNPEYEFLLFNDTPGIYTPCGRFTYSGVKEYLRIQL